MCLYLIKKNYTLYFTIAALQQKNFIQLNILNLFDLPFQIINFALDNS